MLYLPYCCVILGMLCYCWCIQKQFSPFSFLLSAPGKDGLTAWQLVAGQIKLDVPVSTMASFLITTRESVFFFSFFPTDSLNQVTFLMQECKTTWMKQRNIWCRVYIILLCLTDSHPSHIRSYKAAGAMTCWQDVWPSYNDYFLGFFFHIRILTKAILAVFYNRGNKDQLVSDKASLWLDFLSSWNSILRPQWLSICAK